jgi:ribosome assembly protein 3
VKQQPEGKAASVEPSTVEAPKVAGTAEVHATAEAPPKIQPESADLANVKAYYMQRLVKEFAEDLDAVRTADDFSDSSLPVLLQALQKGVSTFSEHEVQRLAAAQKNEE